MRLAPLSTGEGPAPDDLEAILRAYFRAEVPDPWPAPPLTRAAARDARPGPAGRGPGRSRLALAASVALLVAGSLAISSRTPTHETPASPPRMSPGEATRIRLTETLVQPKDSPTEWRIEVTEEPRAGKR
jgi:hypothetical protein